MRIKTTEDRDRLWENLCEATGENARSKALDRAARYYLRMCGGVAAYGRGDIQTLLDAAEEQGSLTAPEIAAILDERELPVTYNTTSSVGPEVYCTYTEYCCEATVLLSVHDCSHEPDPPPPLSLGLIIEWNRQELIGLRPFNSVPTLYNTGNKTQGFTL